MSRLSIGVAGGGLGGLAAAALLARAGHDVTLFEAARTLGGKCHQIEIDGQPIDTGPSLLTFPGVLRELWRRWDALGEDDGEAERVAALTLSRHPQLALHVYDGDQLALPVPEGDPDYDAWCRFAAEHAALGPTLERMLWQPPRQLATSRAAIGMMLRYRGRTSAAAYLRTRGLSPRLRRAIEIHSLDAGVGPARALPLFASLPAVLARDGVFSPVGGMYALVEALARLARAAGAQLVTDAPVEWIRDRRLCAAGDVRRFDRVVVGLDEPRARALLGDPAPPARPSTCSGVAIYGTLSGPLPPRLAGPLVVMPEDDDALFAALEARREPPSTMLMIHGSPARPGARATLSVLVTAPANGRTYGIDHPFVARELERARRWLGLDAPIADLFAGHTVLDPAYFGARGDPGGALYGDVRGLSRSGPLHDVPHRDRRRPWLYRVGAAVHPGGGIPAVLGGAMIAVEGLLADAPRGHPPGPTRNGRTSSRPSVPSSARSSARSSAASG